MSQPSSKHHAEWLSLLEISGPFLSMPVLTAAFPQGLDNLDDGQARSLRADYEFWTENVNDPAVHTAWVRLVLESLLGYSPEVLLTGQSIASGWKAEFPEHEETLRPDMMLVQPGPSGKTPHLLIQVYPPSQSLDKAVQGSRWQASAATRMMELLHATEVRLGLLTNGEQWMLVDAPRGETSGFSTWYAELWFDEQITLRAFKSLLGVQRFFGVAADQTLESLLEASVKDQWEITDQLGLQVRHAVEILIQKIDQADQDSGGKLLGGLSPSTLYEAALTVMMRLVFMLSAEERKLLPLDDSLYAENYAVSTLYAQLDVTEEEVLERRFDAWSRLLAAFRAVYGGIFHDRLNLLPYGGSMFDPDKYPFLEGRQTNGPRMNAEKRGEDQELLKDLKDEKGLIRAPEGRPRDLLSKSSASKGFPAANIPLPVNNRTVLHLLKALQILQIEGEARRISFRALDVEQIGHVYEGLLDHVAVRSTELILGLRGAKRQEPEIALSALEAAAKKNEPDWLAWLKTETGRSETALKNVLAQDTLQKDPEQANRLRATIGNDARLFARLAPFAGLIRADDFDIPVVILPGSVYVTSGSTRRATGTHYTPRSLTEPVVLHTLEPLVYYGPAEGLPREQWRLRRPEELLALKICDMAMGSGGFLVQVVRYLAERLVEAWELYGEGPYPGSGPHPGSSPHPNPLPAGEGTKPVLLPGMLARVRELRQKATDAEVLLWELLRNRQLADYKFRRQHPLGGYILDFYCHEAHLAVELDGSVHNEAQQHEHDIQRTQFLNEQGITVIRFWNHEVLEQASNVLQKILKQLRIQPPSSSSLLPSPPGRRAGEEGDPLILARRLVAERCIYGVDKNPLAVEIAKLSLWLVTMAKDLPFSFLDHALKCGDSLVGCSEDDFLRWAHGYKAATMTLFDEQIRTQLETARSKRRELESFVVNDAQDAARKAELLKEADTAMAHIWRGADLLTGARLLGLKTQEIEDMQINLLFPYMQGLLDEGIDAAKHPDAARALAAAQKERVFHWEFAFPEVFENGGFSAFVGNPPFIGGQRLTGALGTIYRDYLVEHLAKGMRGSSDLCAYFFLQVFNLLRKDGSFGLIATNTIAQGDTRTVGLNVIVKNGGTIYRAHPTISWPGIAAVFVSIVYCYKGSYPGQKTLGSVIVENISPLLDEMFSNKQPYLINSNLGKSFQGSNVLGAGFTMTPDQAFSLIENNPKNSDVLFPLLNGEEANHNPEQKGTRWVINFSNWPIEKAQEYSECFEIVKEKVYPERQKNKDKQRREIWWRFTRPTVELYETISNLNQVMICCAITKHLSFVFVSKRQVFNQRLYVFSFEDNAHFAFVQSNFHETWARKYSSTLKQDLSYTPSDCFWTFPFPKNLTGLEEIGESYHETRRQIMLARQEGLTKTYNRFHNSAEHASDIQQLRELHVQMDTAVAAAYGWEDLALGHDFHETAQGLRYTISESARREVLSRLLKLNHERWEEEQLQGAGDGKKKSGKKNSGTRITPMGHADALRVRGEDQKKKIDDEKPGQYGLF
ncbi:MAG: endonuclease domain-containing protein [Chloroflexi bacterium]|nr:endonuclease domain-containing protein [Chloroflexota bacterium]